MSEPKFAVVGHPNKGKSSIVSTLAHDDSVAIGRIPGTTTRCRTYPMKVDGEVLYTLVDTPGFQRARAALAWMKQHETTADKHPAVVQAFLAAHRDGEHFFDECELLTPVMEGAGILYVVDGSLPYGPEYEAEMEILRWTGQPRMALINPIGPADHIDAWQAALGQYFSVVRVFNALKADFHKRTELLRAFGQLQGAWRAPLQRAVESLEQDRIQRRLHAARLVADTLSGMLTLKIEKKLAPNAPTETEKPPLEAAWRKRLQEMERRCRKAVEEIYDHRRLERIEAGLELLEEHGLFSAESLRLFGLSRLQLLGLGTLSGAAVGGLLDAAVGGASLLLGTLIGGGVGAASTLLAADQLIDVRILNMPLGHKLLVAGPTRSINVPHIVFGRARLHHSLVSRRTHAERGTLTIDEHLANRVRPLREEERRRLEKIFAQLRSAQDNGEARERLFEVVADIFAEDDLVEE
ncbi:hypothetical protein DESUT3_09190 [Desulfuromonas versatilis]|uniref:G domain-containing protein n=1 Tax=Desulfuromonas versatilis TaxID=2802975 RepID=A0ABN6DUX6_9BACT|nr:GTPase/DUF3482 domain-containing protein [Desulfuromonas versatilis]BCR03850.1 hypothetical protein DESUT3_09190 [Desulfuromonas versatilis]